MIALASGCLLFETSGGERVPLSAEMISVELGEDTMALFDPDFVDHAASAVFHYFKHELKRETVSVGEFAGALEKVLRGFQPGATDAEIAQAAQAVAEFDLAGLVREVSAGGELFFFGRLRQELRRKLKDHPHTLRCKGLRECVRQLTGARRWSEKCRALEEQIILYLQECVSVERPKEQTSLVIS